MSEKILCPQCQIVKIGLNEVCEVCGYASYATPASSLLSRIILASQIVIRKAREDIRKTPEDIRKTREIIKKTDEIIGKPRVSPLITLSVVSALIVCFVGFKFYSHIEKASADRKFSAMVTSVAVDIIEMGVTSGGVVNEIERSWRTAIDTRTNFDFAIRMAQKDKLEDIRVITALSKEIGNTIKAMKPPERKEADYQQLKKIYLLFNKYADMAIYPSGSFLSYSASANQLAAEVLSATKELEMMK